jgi:hypothetical protein
LQRPSARRLDRSSLVAFTVPQTVVWATPAHKTEIISAFDLLRIAGTASEMKAVYAAGR